MDATGVLLTLDGRSDDDVVTEKWLARQTGKCHETIRRWRRRGILPPTIKIGNEQTWTIGILKSHIKNLFEKAAAEHEKAMKRLGINRPGMA